MADFSAILKKQKTDFQGEKKKVQVSEAAQEFVLRQQVEQGYTPKGLKEKGVGRGAQKIVKDFETAVFQISDVEDYAGFADFIRTEDHLKIDKISKRAAGYGMPGHTVDGNNVEEVYEISKDAILNAKNGKGPTLIECVTYRHRGHYEGDPQSYRTKEEVDEWKKKDPIKLTEKILLDNKILNNEIINSITNEINNEIEDAVNFARNSSEPELEESFKDIYTDLVERDNLV